MTHDLDAIFENRLDLPPPGVPLDRASLPPGGGVYAFLDADGRVLQTIGAQSLRRSIAFRLEPPDDQVRGRRADIRAIAQAIRWTPTYSVFETSLVYLNVARRLMPGEYRKQLGFGSVWFARIDPGEPFPRWTVENTAFDGQRIDIGPFAERARCAAFIELLEDLFDLCRKYDILVQAPKGQACAYFEMGMCPAPCDGSISMDTYRGAIRRSIEFARGDHECHLQEIEQRMRSAAAAQAFELAGRLKHVRDRARKILKRDGRLTPVPERFRFLVVQRAGGTSRVKPYFVDRGAITTAEPARFRQLSDVLPRWIEAVGHRHNADAIDPVFRSECIWLVSHFLLKGDKAAGVFLHESELHDARLVQHRILDRFKLAPDGSENTRDGTNADPQVDFHD